MAVTREKYQELVNREMRRYGRGGTGGESSRDKAVRAANIAAGYGNSTALKYPVKAGGGGRSMSREGGDGKGGTAKKAAADTGGTTSAKGGDSKLRLGSLSRNPYETQRGDPDYGPPGRLSDENAVPSPDDFGPPGRLSPENAGPLPLVPRAVVLPGFSSVRPGEGPGGLPPSRFGPQVEPQGRPPGGLRTPGVFSLPGRPDDFDQGTEGLPYERSADRVILPLGGPGGPGEPYAAHQNSAPPSGFSIMDLLGGLRTGAAKAGRAVAPWLQDKMF